MKKYPRDFVEKVVSSTNIIDIISQYTVLKMKGKDLWGLCPFPDHKEKSPSFSVSQERQLYHCFGCKKGGNVFTFLEHLQGLTFPEALEYLANRAKIDIPQKSNLSISHNLTQGQNEYDLDKNKRKQLLEILKSTSQYFQDTLLETPAHFSIHTYIHERKISSEIIREFGLGFSSSEWDGLVQHLKNKKFSLTLAEELGLIRSKEKNPSDYYDLFRERLMFTISNPMGEPIGFGGRVLDQSLPKYINSPESKIYHKGKTLFGLHQSGKYIRSENCAIVVEGYMDLISLYQAGIKNVVAPLGTALTLDQCRLLTRFTKNVVVLFDGDEAGQSALERSLPILLEAGSYPKGLVLSNNLDPDEFVKKFGTNALNEKIKLAQDLFSLLLDKWLINFNGSAIGKMQVINKIKPFFGIIKESALRSLYIKELSFKLGTDEKWVFEALKNPAHANTVPTRTTQLTFNSNNLNLKNNSPSNLHSIEINKNLNIEEEENQKITLHGAPKVEILLLALLLAGQKEIRVQILHEEVYSSFTHSGIKKLIEKFNLMTGQSNTPSVNLIALITQNISHLEQLTSAISQLPESKSEEEIKLLNDCIKKLRINFIDQQVKVLVNELKISSNLEKLEKLSFLQKERMKTITGEIKK